MLPGTQENLPESIDFLLYRVSSKTPFTRVPSTGGSIYLVKDNETLEYDSHLLSSDDQNENYGVYRVTKDENWSVTFNGLLSAETDSDGNTLYYAYYVKEKPLTGYTTTYTTNGATRTIVNREPLPEGKYINIGLEKKWTDGTNTTPPSGASATFTVHQQKSTKSGVEGNLTVNLNDEDGELLGTLKASDGDVLSLKDYHFAAWQMYSGVQAQINYAKEESWGTSWQNAGYLEEAWDGTLREQTIKIEESKMSIDGIVTLKISTKKADFSTLPVFNNTSGGSASFSEYVDTTWTKSVTLPTTAGAWSTTIKDLIQEDADGNLYRYYITEDSCTPAASTTVFKDNIGNGNEHTINTSGQKVEVTNTYEASTGKLKLTKIIQTNGTPDASKTGTFYYAVYSTEFDANANPPQTPVSTGSINVTTDGTATATVTELPYGKYYVYELTGQGGTPIVSGTDGTLAVINDIPYTVKGSGTEVTVGASGSAAEGTSGDDSGNDGIGQATGTNTSASNSVTLINNYETTSAQVKKVWNDNNNAKNKRPASLTVTLYADTNATAHAVTLSNKNYWEGAVIENLPKYNADGTEINYYWVEGHMPEGYFLKSISKEGIITTLAN